MSLPVPISGSPYGNGDPFVLNPHMETVINFSIWWSPNPYGDSEGDNCRGRQSQSWWQRRWRRLRIDSNNICASATGNNTTSVGDALRGGGGVSQGRGGQRTRGGGGATSGALRVATTSWQRRGRGKVARRSQRRSTTGATRQPADKQEANGRGGLQEANGKHEVRCQRTRGDGALIGRGWAFRGGGRVERMWGGGINATTSHWTRDYRGGGKSDGNGDGCMMVWYVRSVSTRKLARFGEKDILQCVTKWMAKNTVPVTIWGVPIWKGEGRQKNCIWGLPVTIRCL